MGTWQWVDDISYKGFLLSVYALSGTRYDNADIEIRVREGNGVDEKGEWLEALYIAHLETYDQAVKDGKDFVNELVGFEFGGLLKDLNK